MRRFAKLAAAGACAMVFVLTSLARGALSQPVLVVAAFWAADEPRPDQVSRPIETRDRCGKPVKGYVANEAILSDKDFRFSEAAVEASMLRHDKEARFRVMVPLTAEGKKALETWSAGHVGHFVIVQWRGQVLGVTRILQPYGGPLFLEGCFTREEADKLATGLREAL